ncbi:MAG: hypothetical protein BWY98_00440 [Tenericutes bacterium ADurb.BinA155]|nr:MAG: hypothetical protein BWY98_00440 [Tenericutes bacterium ADurb.BinA155]
MDEKERLFGSSNTIQEKINSGKMSVWNKNYRTFYLRFFLRDVLKSCPRGTGPLLCKRIIASSFIMGRKES